MGLAHLARVGAEHERHLLRGRSQGELRVRLRLRLRLRVS